MDTTDFDRLLYLKQQVMELQDYDAKVLRVFNEQLHNLIQIHLNNLTLAGKKLPEVYSECLKNTTDNQNSSGSQLRADILFSIDLCLHVIREASRTN